MAGLAHQMASARCSVRGPSCCVITATAGFFWDLDVLPSGTSIGRDIQADRGLHAATGEHYTVRMARRLGVVPGRRPLHALWQRHAEQAEAGGQHAEHRRAQGKPGLPDLVVVGLEHRALLVERGEQAGDLEEVDA